MLLFSHADFSMQGQDKPQAQPRLGLLDRLSPNWDSLVKALLELAPCKE